MVTCHPLLSAICLLASFAASSATIGIDDPSLDAKVEALLRQMTPEEKVAQLVQYPIGQPTGPETGLVDLDTMIARGQVGALLGTAPVRRINTYQRLAMQGSRLHIPLLFGLDVIHGYRTVFPIPLGLASSWDTALIERTARVAAREASAAGIRWTFSPMVDIARDARWGRIAESAGEDPYLGSQIAPAYVRGYQGTRLDAPDSLAACAKHFVGYGAAEGGRDYNTTEISEHTLRDIYLPPFHAAVSAGAASLMSAFNALNGVPASANRFTLTQVLREEWGFRGLVDSDWLAVAQLIPHGIAIDGADAAEKAFESGVDMDMTSGLYHRHLLDLIEAGRISPARLDESVRRVLRVKLALGLLEHPYTDESQESGAMLQPAAVVLAREAAERSFVLLKNADVGGKPILPLSDSVRHVALIGPLADDATDMLGSWPGAGRGEDVVTLRQSFEERLGNRRLRYALGTGLTEGSDAAMRRAMRDTLRADVIVMALGESHAMSGEAASRANLTLPGRQQELLEKMVATGKPVVLILFSGRPLTLPWAFEKVPAVIAAWAPGIQAGPALVRTLFGESNPSGRLTVSWPRSVGQLPLYYNALNTGRPRNNPAEKQYVTGYLDEELTPQFPFGFGLSYTTFDYGPTQLSRQRLQPSASEGLTATAQVTNTGSRAGSEVVQLYVRLQGTSTAQPVRVLKGFQNIVLASGESRTATFQLPSETLAVWDIHNRYAVEPARATVWIAPDSARGKGAELEIVP